MHSSDTRSTKSAQDSFRAIVESLRTLEVRILPCVTWIGSVLTVLLLVAGIGMGVSIHSSISSLSNGLLVVGAVATIFVWDLWDAMALIIGILELVVMREDLFEETLQEYLQRPSRGTQAPQPNQNSPSCPSETLIGKLHYRLANLLCRRCYIALVVFPLLIVVVALQCVVVGLVEDAPSGVLGMYVAVATMSLGVAIIGFSITHFKFYPVIACKTKEMIDPYLDTWLTDIEKDVENIEKPAASCGYTSGPSGHEVFGEPSEDHVCTRSNNPIAPIAGHVISSPGHCAKSHQV
jgi:hypothetical protein